MKGIRIRNYVLLSLVIIFHNCRFLKLRPRLSERSNWSALLEEHHHPVRINKVRSKCIQMENDYWTKKIAQIRSVPWGDVYSGMFTSPVATMLPGFLPAESQTAR